jgi:CheY-like chemotaxis protein
MDVQMPDMDGLAATAAIRDREVRISGGDAPPPGSSFAAGGRIPVVAVTAHAMAGDAERCRAAGMDGYVTKPIQARELEKEIERLVPRQPPAAPEPPAPPVDLDLARRLAAGDEELRAEVAAVFVDGCRRYQADLREAVRAGDSARVGRIAHALKGASGSVAATTAQSLAAELEALSRNGHDERLVALAADLEREVGRVTEFLATPRSAKSG